MMQHLTEPDYKYTNSYTQEIYIFNCSHGSYYR